MSDNHTNIDFQRVNIEIFAKRTRQQIRELKQALKKLNGLIHQDFGLLVNLDNNSISFLGDSSKYAKKLYEAQEECTKIINEALKKHY